MKFNWPSETQLKLKQLKRLAKIHASSPMLLGVMWTGSMASRSYGKHSKFTDQRVLLYKVTQYNSPIQAETGRKPNGFLSPGQRPADTVTNKTLTDWFLLPCCALIETKPVLLTD